MDHPPAGFVPFIGEWFLLRNGNAGRALESLERRTARPRDYLWVRHVPRQRTGRLLLHTRRLRFLGSGIGAASVAPLSLARLGYLFTSTDTPANRGGSLLPHRRNKSHHTDFCQLRELRQRQPPDDHLRLWLILRDRQTQCLELLDDIGGVIGQEQLQVNDSVLRRLAVPCLLFPALECFQQSRTELRFEQGTLSGRWFYVVFRGWCAVSRIHGWKRYHRRRWRRRDWHTNRRPDASVQVR